MLMVCCLSLFWCASCAPEISAFTPAPAFPRKGPGRKSYQLAFTTPGIIPSRASFLKQIRQRPNFLR
jgi:hypothetical protein